MWSFGGVIPALAGDVVDAIVSVQGGVRHPPLEFMLGLGGRR